MYTANVSIILGKTKQMRSIINLFQLPFYKTVSSNGKQDFMEFSPLDRSVYSTLG